MTAGGEVLLVGQDFHHAQILTVRLRQWGFHCHFAETLQAAAQLLSSYAVDVVLSEAHLPDGTGFGLVAALTALPVTAFICLPVEDSCYWLPALDRGRDCWGSPALRPAEFALAIQKLARRSVAPPRNLAVPQPGNT